MLSLRSRLAAACCVLVVTFAVPAAAQVRSFDGPRHEGFDVSYCGADAASCGERMATTWCTSQGYEYASGWAARAGVDAASRAVSLDDGEICEGAACESFASITCGPEVRAFTAPVLGSAGNATVLSPDLRSTAAVLDTAEYRVLIPGCSQREPGVFLCESTLEYQHCRTLMIARLIYSCRAGLAFDGGFAQPHAADPATYELAVDSDAMVRVRFGDRGFGQIKGEADVELTIQPPIEAEGAWCLQRDPYIYFPSGPMGGMSEIGEPTDCDEPIEFSFEAHEDDLLRAYDLCDSFSAWGLEIEDSIDILAAGLFQVRSTSSEFTETDPDGAAVIAPFVRVEAPLTVDCRL